MSVSLEASSADDGAACRRGYVEQEAGRTQEGMRAAGSIAVVIERAGRNASKERVCISQNHSTGSAALEVTRIDLKLSRQFTPAPTKHPGEGETGPPARPSAGSNSTLSRARAVERICT